MTLLACRKGPDSQQSVTHPSARVMCVRPWFTPLLPGNQSVGPWPSFWLGKELSMFLLSLFFPLNRARDIVFLHFSCEGGKDGASAADKDPGDLKTWEVLVPKASLTNRAAWPFHRKAKCHIRPRPWELWEREQGLLLACILMVETVHFLPPLCKTHKHSEAWILGTDSVAPHERHVLDDCQEKWWKMSFGDRSHSWPPPCSSKCHSQGVICSCHTELWHYCNIKLELLSYERMVGFSKQEDNPTLPYICMLPETLRKQWNITLGALHHPKKMIG